MNDPDPRFQNSQFIHFLNRIKNGEVVIHGKEITEVKPDLAMMDNAFKDAEGQQSLNHNVMSEGFENSVLKQK